MAEVAEGEEVRPGLPILDIVDSTRDAGARAGQPGGRRRDRAGPAREDPSRRVSGSALRRPGRARRAARRAELDDAEGAVVRRARVDPGHERETDAGPHARRSRSSPPAATRRAARRRRRRERADVALVLAQTARRRPRRGDDRPGARRGGIRGAQDAAADPTSRPPRSRAATSSRSSRRAATSGRSGRSLVTAPFQAGELQILKLAANGSAVKQGDVVADFDALTLRRTLQDKQSELRQAQAELDQADAAIEDRRRAGSHGGRQGEVRRRAREARLGRSADAGAGGSRAHQAALVRRGAAAERSGGQGSRRQVVGHDRPRRRRSARSRRSRPTSTSPRAASRSLQVKAPADGTVNILPNYRIEQRHGRRRRNSSPAIAPGQARRFSSCPICRRCT